MESANLDEQDSRRFMKPDMFRSVGVMPKLSTVLAWLCLALCLWATPAHCQERDVIRLVAFNYPPFYFLEHGEIRGIAVDLINELFARLHVRTEITMFPLPRVLAHLKQGEADGVMILIKTPERQQFLEYTVPVMTVRGLIWTSADRKHLVEFDALEDLSEYVIGVTRGYSYGQEFDELLKIMKVDVANADYNNYLKLLEKRIDVFPGNEIVARGLFKMHPELRGKFVHSDKTFIKWVLHMAISKKSKYRTMIPAINRVLADMEQDGSIERAVSRHTK